MLLRGIRLPANPPPHAAAEADLSILPTFSWGAVFGPQLYFFPHWKGSEDKPDDQQNGCGHAQKPGNKIPTHDNPPKKKRKVQGNPPTLSRFIHSCKRQNGDQTFRSFSKPKGRFTESMIGIEAWEICAEDHLTRFGRSRMV